MDGNLDLRNIKVHNDMSEETVCFSASIYWKGKRIGVARNGGRGGCNFYEWLDKDASDELDRWVEQQHLTYTGFDGEEKEVTFEKLDWIVNELVEKHEKKKWLRRKTRTQILFRIEGDEEGSYKTVRHQGKPIETVEWVRNKYGDTIIELHSPLRD